MSFIPLNKLTIRSVKKSDWPSLLFLIDELGYCIDQKDLKKNILHYQKDPLKKVFVCCLDRQPIGFIALSFLDFFHEKKRVGRIVALVVQKEMLRQKVGTLLLQKVEDYAKKKECSLLELTCSAHRKKMGTHDFYEQMGYHNKEEKLYLRKSL
jgi:GNAT superfamily N-acetyltransferase